MSKNSKEKIKQLIPSKLQPVVKLFVKRIWYFGLKYKCPVCHSYSRFMKPLGFDFPVLKQKKVIGAGKRNAMCPVCFSSDRVRLLFLFLKTQTNIFNQEIRLLHIAPEKPLKEIFEKQKNINYLTADVNPENVMVQMDITDIKYAENSFDAIICNHVLEHITNDRKAMKELLRVLKPDGWAILQVPVSKISNITFEDNSVTSPIEREKVFGQFDHVKIYGLDYPEILKEVGFIVNEFKWPDYPAFGGFKNKFHLNEDETVFFCKKPDNTNGII